MSVISWPAQRGMLDVVHAIQEYIDGMSYEQFRNDRRTVDAVIRRLMIIGEAAVNALNFERRNYRMST